MKISVIGNIIDTEDIYIITPIIGDGCWTRSSLNSNSHLSHSGYSFIIKFFNNKKLIIRLDGQSEFGYGKIIEKTMWYDNPEEYKEKIQILEHKLNELRNQVIKYWLDNQTVIPKIEFNDFKKDI